VSLIEQASKRLEELRRAGVEVPDDLERPAAGAAARGVAPVPETPSTPELIAESGDIPALQARQAAVRAPSARAQPSAGSKRVTLDLVRLAAAGLVTPDAPHSPIAHEFRVIKRPLIANSQGKSGARTKDANLVMITSAMDGEGKTYSAINLAMSLAMEQDSTALLVDADVANSSILEALGLPQSQGLLDLLVDPTLDLAQVLLRTNVDGLSILPAGTRHERATELLASAAMTRLVNDLATRHPDRIIVFDSPPLLLTTESPVLATHMGQVVVVVEAERTTVNALKRALEKIQNCPVVMTILNKARVSEGGSYYGGYGYRYGR
jgi:protein-tyrosine kinase